MPERKALLEEIGFEKDDGRREFPDSLLIEL